MALECARTEKALLVKKQLRKHFRRSPACGSEVLQGALCLALTLLQHQEFKIHSMACKPYSLRPCLQVVSEVLLAGRERPALAQDVTDPCLSCQELLSQEASRRLFNHTVCHSYLSA